MTTINPTQTASCPPIILCVGLPRSASTWAYNAVLMLCRQHADSIGIFSDVYHDIFAEIIRLNKVIVIKAHNPNNKLLELVSSFGGKIIITVRDPRDCVASLIEAFNYRTITAIEYVQNSCESIKSIDVNHQNLLIRYEDISGRLEVVGQIARELGLPENDATQRVVADALLPEKIRSEIIRLTNEGVLDAANPAQSWIEETHWHPNHLGDGRTGKYQDLLTPIDAVTIGRNNRFFLERFGYEPPTDLAAS